MAAESALQELYEEVSCSICLELFRDPVSLAECGHSFCRACLSHSWGESGAELSCPQCRGRARKKNLRPNKKLASFVEIAKKLRPLEGKEAEAKGGEGEAGVCEKHQEPLKFFCEEDEDPLCVVCCRSQEHREHEVTLLEEAAGERQTIVAARKDNVCQKHQELLKLFCKDDEAPICVVCEQSQEHKYHEIVPVEEAFQEYKDQFCNCVGILWKKRSEILACKASVLKESQGLLKKTKGERQKTVSQFRQLHTFLEEQEALLLARVEEVEKEVAKKRDRHLAKLSETLFSLDRLIQEMKEKCEQPAGDLLQGVRNTLQRYEEMETFENPAAFPLALKWRIWDLSDINLLLEGIEEQLKDTLESGLHLQKASVTLDPDTAHPQLILSDGQKSVRRGEEAQALRDNPERFDQSSSVLGREGFTAGRHFWEVLVGSEEEWTVGVARKSVKRKGDIEEGIWEVGKWDGIYQASEEDRCPVLTLSGELKRIRVCLNCTGRRVSFFDADRAALLYEYSGVSSEETLLPLFWVREKGHLRIS